MARRSIAPLPPPPVSLALAARRSDAAEKLRSRIALGRKLQIRQLGSGEAVEGYKKDTKIWSDYNEELLKHLFSNDSLAQEYRDSFSGAMAFDEAGAFAIYRENIDNWIKTLESILNRLELYPEPSDPSTQPIALEPRHDLSRVFVVHGRDEGAREAIARFLERLNIKPVILHETANHGQTIIEKVETYGDVGFAVILLTPDDEGCVKGGRPSPRARQNVVLELGYFIGRLGRKNVYALKRGELEIPSDFAGIVYGTYDESGGWKQALGRELQSAGFTIDWNLVMRS